MQVLIVILDATLAVSKDIPERSHALADSSDSLLDRLLIVSFHPQQDHIVLQANSSSSLHPSLSSIEVEAQLRVVGVHMMDVVMMNMMNELSSTTLPIHIAHRPLSIIIVEESHPSLRVVGPKACCSKLPPHPVVVVQVVFLEIPNIDERFLIGDEVLIEIPRNEQPTIVYLLVKSRCFNLHFIHFVDEDRLIVVLRLID